MRFDGDVRCSNVEKVISGSKIRSDIDIVEFLTSAGSTINRNVLSCENKASKLKNSLIKINGILFRKEGDIILGNGKVYYLKGELLASSSSGKIWTNVNSSDELLKVLERDN